MDQREYKDPKDLNFHYNREDREETLSEAIRDRSAGRKIGLFKRNPTLLIILADIILIILIAMFVFTFLLKKENIKSFQGFSMNFKGLIYDENSLLSIKFSVTGEKSEFAGKNAQIIFSIDDQPETKTVVITLPESEGTYEIARISLPAAEPGKLALAVVQIGEEKITMKTKLKNEF